MPATEVLQAVKFENGRPVKPDLATLNVNLFGLINSGYLH